MINFIEKTHQYLIDGILVPSVSEILHFIFPNKYKNINQEILNNKAKYGTIIHESIELLEKNVSLDEIEIIKNLNYIQVASLKQYLKLKTKYDLKVLSQEQIISYKDLYAGRFDMIADIKGITSLCDIKTTAELDIEYLSWQLSFYELGTGKTYEKYYVIWLPKKDIGKIIEVPKKSKKELLKKIKEFYESCDNYENFS